MHDETMIVRERQRLIRREMDRRGILVKAVQLDGGWDSPSTVQSYFPAHPEKEPAMMSVGALYRLLSSKALPVELLNMLLPDGWRIVRDEEDFDPCETAVKCAEFISRFAQASPTMTPDQRERLAEKAASIRFCMFDDEQHAPEPSPWRRFGDFLARLVGDQT